MSAKLARDLNAAMENSRRLLKTVREREIAMLEAVVALGNGDHARGEKILREALVKAGVIRE